jgi:hypothetical protein
MTGDATFTLALRTTSYLIDGSARDTLQRALRIGVTSIDLPVLSQCTCCHKRHVVTVDLSEYINIVEHDVKPPNAYLTPSWAVA